MRLKSRGRRVEPRIGAMLGVFVLFSSCSNAKDSVRVSLPVQSDSAGLQPVDTDLGYRVHLEHVRLAARDFQFTVAGEAHVAALVEQVLSWLVSPALAHPGHYQGGETTGEMAGSFVVEWHDSAAPAEIGMSTLLEGEYHSVNFILDRGSAAHGLAASDPLFGHTATLSGTATRDDDTVQWTATLDSPIDRLLVGAPFAVSIRGGEAGAIGFRVVTLDPLEGDTLFDGIDFFALDEDADGHVAIELGAEPEDSSDEGAADAYNLLRRTFQSHDQFEFVLLGKTL